MAPSVILFQLQISDNNVRVLAVGSPSIDVLPHDFDLMAEIKQEAHEAHEAQEALRLNSMAAEADACKC